MSGEGAKQSGLEQANGPGEHDVAAIPLASGAEAGLRTEHAGGAARVPYDISPEPASAYGGSSAQDADLSPSPLSRRWVALVLGLTFVVYLLFLPNFLLYSSPPTGDQPFYLMDTISLAQDRDLNVLNNYEQRDEDKFYSLAPRPPGFVGMLAPYPLPRQLANATARPPTEAYSFHLPGLSVALVPAWVVGSWFQLWWPATLVFMCLVGALVAVNVFLLAYETTGRVPIALAVWVPVAFSNPIMTYSYLLFTELPTGLLLIYAFRRLALGWRANGHLRLLLVGVCAAYIPWLAWRCMPLSVMLGVYAGVQLWRERRARTHAQLGDTPRPVPRRSGVLRPALIFVPLLLSAGLLASYHFFLFGKPMPALEVPEQGGALPFHWPWAGLDQLRQFLSDAFGLLFDRQFGLLVYAPVYLLSAVGMVALFRAGGRHRRLLAGSALVALPYLGVIVAFDLWTGIWCPPARYLTTFVPLLAAPLGMSLLLVRSLIYKALYLVLSLVGMALMYVMLADARLFWPVLSGGIFLRISDMQGFSFVANLLHLLPRWPPEPVRHPMTSGLLLGASTAIVLFCCALLMRNPARSRPDLPLRARGAVWLGALAVVWGAWFSMNWEYLKHSTSLAEIGRWPLQPAPTQPYGLAYKGGRLFYAAYEGDGRGFMGMLDPKTGESRIVTPSGEGGVLQYAHPGDVKVGPDGLLYLLNNGEGEHALLTLDEDGRIERKNALAGKSSVAIGLSFGPDGMLYVSDMIGGRLNKYRSNGGELLASWSSEKGMFNNPTGVAVSPAGMVYAAEAGSSLIYEFDSQGKPGRKFNPRCKPVHMIATGEWLDVACENRIVSVSTRSGEIQLAYTAPEAAPLVHPTGLTFDPDGTLYVLDTPYIVAYKVRR